MPVSFAYLIHAVFVIHCQLVSLSCSSFANATQGQTKNKSSWMLSVGLNVEWKHFVIQTHFSDAVCGFNLFKFPVTILQPCLLKLACNNINLVFCGISYKSPCISTFSSLYTARDNLAVKTSTFHFPAIATLLYVLDVLDWVNQANYSECSNTECRECAQPCCGV